MEMIVEGAVAVVVIMAEEMAEEEAMGGMGEDLAIHRARIISAS